MIAGRYHLHLTTTMNTAEKIEYLKSLTSRDLRAHLVATEMLITNHIESAGAAMSRWKKTGVNEVVFHLDMAKDYTTYAELMKAELATR